MHFRAGTTPAVVIWAPETSLIWPAGQKPSSTRMRWPSLRLTMSCSRATCSAMAGDASAHNATPANSHIEGRRIVEVIMVGRLSLVLDLEAVRAEIDLQALRFLFGLVEIVAEHADDDDQRADDQEQDIAVAGHPVSPVFPLHSTDAGAILI